MVCVRVNRSKSSTRWLREHFADSYVKQAQAAGLRSRAAYKLSELIERDRLLRPRMNIIDLGAAPGGWTQVLREHQAGQRGAGGRLIALDILPMQGIAGVDFLQGDFRAPEVQARLETLLQGEKLDLVLSDMAPNMSGVVVSDQARAMELAELATGFARQWLKPEGALLVKLFQGNGFDDFVRDLRGGFQRVSMRKPKASRARSREVYALATGLKPGARTERKK